MIEQQFEQLLAIQFESKLLIFDNGNLTEFYINILRKHNYTISFYNDVENFRLLYETEIQYSTQKWAVICIKNIFVPFDVKQDLYQINMSLESLFPRLNSFSLRKHIRDLKLICFAYPSLLENRTSETLTEEFVSYITTNENIIQSYINEVLLTWEAKLNDRLSTSEWITIAEEKAKLHYYSAKAGLSSNFGTIDNEFQTFILNNFQKISSETHLDFPVILPKVLNHISDGKKKVALIVMDGMSMFDFEVISRYFIGINYLLNGSFALIPTITAISRQCLLSGKYPKQLKSPFSLNREKKEFIEASINLGYQERQVQFERGYNTKINSFTKMISIIINDVDDLVHSQMQGRIGMYNDISFLAKEGKLQVLINNLWNSGFEIYITSDHGNTLCEGVGSIPGIGVETESKAKRMLILKNFAHPFQSIKDFVIKYPGFYLDKQYQYYICKNGLSFDSVGNKVMTHGGISLDEVIVPFIKIETVEKTWVELLE